PMTPCRQEFYQGENFKLSYRCGNTPVEPDQEPAGHVIRMENAEPAAISLFPAGTRLSLCSAACNALVLAFAPTLLEKSLGGQPVALDLQARERIQDSRIQHLMYALLEGARAGCPAGSIYAGSLVTAISNYLARHYSVRREITSRPVMPPARLN